MLVLFIIALMASVMAPAFSSLVRGTKFQQTIEAVMAALHRGKVESQTLRIGRGGSANGDPNLVWATGVVVYFGEASYLNTAGVQAYPTQVAPVAGVLPPYGQIEVWTANCPVVNNVATPFTKKLDCLTPAPITFPDPIRILTGELWVSGERPPLMVVFSFYETHNSDVPPSNGELTRHEFVYNRYSSGNFVRLNDAVLIFNNQTEEYVVVRGRSDPYEGQRYMRPYIYPYPLTHIGTTYDGYDVSPPFSGIHPGTKTALGAAPNDLVTLVNNIKNP